MDPFRNELDAAHAKIAQLEEEIRQLKGAHYPPPPWDSADLFAKQRQGDAMVWTVIGILAVIFVGAFMAIVVYFVRSTPPPSSSIPPGPGATSSSP